MEAEAFLGVSTVCWSVSSETEGGEDDESQLPRTHVNQFPSIDALGEPHDDAYSSIPTCRWRRGERTA